MSGHYNQIILLVKLKMYDKSQQEVTENYKGI